MCEKHAVRCGAPGSPLDRSISRPLTAKDDQVWGITGRRRPGGLELGHRVQLTLTQHPQGAAGALWARGGGEGT